jgi:hypothetical protein
MTHENDICDMCDAWDVSHTGSQCDTIAPNSSKMRKNERNKTIAEAFGHEIYFKTTPLS